MKTQIILGRRLIALWDVPDHIRVHDTLIVNSVPWTVCSTSYQPPGVIPESQDVYVDNPDGLVDGWFPHVNRATHWPVELIS